MTTVEYLASIGFHEPVIISLFLVFVLGVGIQWIAQIKKIPGIILLLPAGMFFGAYLGLIDPTSLFGESFYTLVTLGVGFLLLADGLNLNFSKLEKSEKSSIKKMILFNTILCLVLGTLIISYLFNMKWYDATLIASLLIVSGPTVIGPILEYSKPNERLKHITMWEAIVTDPLGAEIATIILYFLLIFHNPDELLNTASSPFGQIIHNVLQNTIFKVLMVHGIYFDDLIITAILGVVIGCLLGVLIAAFYIQAKNRGLIKNRYVLIIIWMLVFGGILLGELIFPEAGLFTALVIGIVLANKEKRTARITKKLSDFIEPIIIGLLFITLSAMVDLNKLWEYMVPSLVLVAILIFIIRPLTTFIATYKEKLTFKEKIFISSVHPRGIVAAASASLFSLKLNHSGVGIPQLVPVVFIVILATVIIYGFFTPYITKKLGLNTG